MNIISTDIDPEVRSHQPPNSHENFVLFFLGKKYVCNGALITTRDILLLFDCFVLFSNNTQEVNVQLRNIEVQGVESPAFSYDCHLAVVKVSSIAQYKKL